MALKSTTDKQTALVPSLEQSLANIHDEWSKLGVPADFANTKALKHWFEEYGFKMVIVSLHRLYEVDPKSFLQAANAWGEYVVPKTQRIEGSTKEKTSITINMPGSNTPTTTNINSEPLPIGNIAQPPSFQNAEMPTVLFNTIKQERVALKSQHEQSMVQTKESEGGESPTE
jgi:hypothetical protein